MSSMQHNLMNEVPMPIKSMETHDHVYLIVGSVTPFSTVPMCPKPNVEFTPSKRGCILALRDEKYTYHNIVWNIGGCAPSTAWKTVQQELKHHTQDSLHRSGCPFALDDRTCCRIIQALRANCFMFFSDVAAMLECAMESQVWKTAQAVDY